MSAEQAPTVQSETQAGLVTVSAPHGATISTAYVRREVKAYAVLETEVRTIAWFNTLSAAFFSTSSALVFCAVGLWGNSAFAEKLTPPGEILSHFVAPALCAFAVLFAALGVWVRRSRKSTWETICNETQSGPQPTDSSSSQPTIYDPHV
jgi:hypothetical protein